MFKRKQKEKETDIVVEKSPDDKIDVSSSDMASAINNSLSKDEQISKPDLKKDSDKSSEKPSSISDFFNIANEEVSETNEIDSVEDDEPKGKKAKRKDRKRKTKEMDNDSNKEVNDKESKPEKQLKTKGRFVPETMESYKENKKNGVSNGKKPKKETKKKDKKSRKKIIKEEPEVFEETILVEETTVSEEIETIEENILPHNEVDLAKEETTLEDDVNPENEVAKDMSAFFEDSNTKTEKLKIKDKKRKKPKKTKKQSKKERNLEAIKDQRVFRFRGKRYQKVEDFIGYLNQHYLDIDEIAQEVLDDENFFGWVNKKSGVLDVSLQEYKEILAKIENKS